MHGTLVLFLSASHTQPGFITNRSPFSIVVFIPARGRLANPNQRAARFDRFDGHDLGGLWP